ncbi:MAG: adenine phosphoribosyltransferase [Alphaproteobacteria bacterium]|nr:adenine phosphoribosyltransferase [Rhodospirillales bacterium]MDP6588246.1 adenine phosphoribosyltransferase [Alphaproteobacteria bacterium]MDP6819035.1 adenine phosphoribosyltransferase [Alphaproteobacteria bacterium]
MRLQDHVGEIPDFPKPGILFYDISPLLAHSDAWIEAVEQLAAAVAPHKPDLLVGIESRGFLVAAPLAFKMGLGFVMIRKRGKLPGDTIGHEYSLEYGTDAVEIKKDLIRPGQRVAILDDLLATGGTARATMELLNQVGANVVGAVFLIELVGLGGHEQLDGLPHTALMRYPA